MFNDDEEKLQPEADDTTNNVMSPPQALQHSADPVIKKPIKLNESTEE